MNTLKAFLKRFTFKRLSIILGFVVSLYATLILGDYFEEVHNTSFIMNVAMYVTMVFAPIIFGIYIIAKAIKEKRVDLLDLLANYIIFIVWLNIIGTIISILVSDGTWFIEQNTSVFLNGLEYVMIYLWNDLWFSGITVITIVLTLVVRIIKKIVEKAKG